jgi:Ca2+-binding EF-hand superfamily protein
VNNLSSSRLAHLQGIQEKSSGAQRQSHRTNGSISNSSNAKKFAEARHKLPIHLREKIQQKSKQVRQAFRLMDFEKNSVISQGEFKHALADMGLRLNDYEVGKIMNVVERDNNSNGINFVDFCDGFFAESNDDAKLQVKAPAEPKRGGKRYAAAKDHEANELFGDVDALDTARREERQKRREKVRQRRQQAMLNQIPEYLKDKIAQKSKHVSTVFLALDQDKSGSISATEFRHGMADLGVALNDSEMTRIMQVVDKDKSGTMEYDEVSEHSGQRLIDWLID